MAATQDAQELFNSHDSAVAPLGLVVTEGARELGEKINAHLVSWATPDNNPRGTFLVENECPRFSSGDSKGLIRSTIRGDDLFFLVDVGNYSCTYKLFGKQNAMSPDDHFQDLKRLIQAASGKAHRISVIMPLLYGGRQHRRSYRESLDCACALQELQAMGVSNIVTFDAHDSRVQNAVPLMGFDNVMPYYQVLKALTRKIPDLKLNREHFMVVSPDEGAMNRNMYYARSGESIWVCSIKEGITPGSSMAGTQLSLMSILALPLRVRISLSPTIFPPATHAGYRL